MKHFFIIFGLFCLAVLRAPDTQAANLSQQLETIRQSLSEDFERTKNLPPEQVSVIDHPENLTVFSPVLWHLKDAGPLTGKKGLGPWTENEFVRGRWVSCYSGTQGDNNLISGIHLIPTEGWTIQQPVIPMDTTGQLTEETIFRPAVYPLPDGQTKTTEYRTPVFFPIFARIAPDKPLSLEKQITVTSCEQFISGPQCTTATLPMSLTLPENEHLPTPICGGIINQLQSTPIPPAGKATVEAIQNEHGAIQLLFTFHETVKGLSIQMDNDFSFVVQKMHLTGQKAFVILIPDKPIPLGTTLNLKVLSSAGWFDIPTRLKQGAFTISNPAFSWGTAISSGFLLLLFSPFYMLFFGWRVTDKKTFVREIRNVRYGILIGSVLTGLIWQSGLLKPSLFLSEPITFFIGLVTAVGLIIRPVRTVISTFILFWLTPKPFLDETFIQATHWYPMAICLIWGFILLIPFNFIHTFSDSFFRFYKYVPQAAYQIGVMMRLPTLLLLAWGLFVHALPLLVTAEDAPYHPDTIQKAVQNGQSVFVMVTDDMNFQNAYNQLISGQVHPAAAWRKQGKLIFMRVGLNTPAGQKLVRELALPNRPFTILYGPLKPNGIIIDERIPEEKWFHRMREVNPL